MSTSTNPSNLKPNEDSSKLHGYLTMYNGKKYEVWTNSGTYAAQNIACEYFRVPKNKGYKIIVNLCVKPENIEVVHTAVD